MSQWINDAILLTHYSSLITHHLDVREPVAVLAVRAFGDGEEALLQGAGHLPGHRAANPADVHFTGRRHLRSRAGEEDRIRDIDLDPGAPCFAHTRTLVAQHGACRGPSNA